MSNQVWLVTCGNLFVVQDVVGVYSTQDVEALKKKCEDAFVSYLQSPSWNRPTSLEDWATRGWTALTETTWELVYHWKDLGSRNGHVYRIQQFPVQEV